MALNKKRSLYANDTDGRALDALSKAALLDIVVEFLRCETDCADAPLTAADLAENDRIKAVLTARGDRLLPCAAELFAKANKALDKQRASDNRAAFLKAKWADRAAHAEKIAQQDALLAERNATLQAEWDAIRAERAARKGADVALMEALNALGGKPDAAAHAKAFPFRAQREAEILKRAAEFNLHFGNER